MSRFSVGFRTTQTGAQAILEFIGSGQKARLIELGLSANAATQAAVGLAYPAAIGVTPTSAITLLAENSDSAVTAITYALAWGTAPTAPTLGYYYRRGTIPASQGGLLWTWPSGGGMALLPSTSIVLYLFAVGSVLDGWAVFEQ